MHKTFTAVCHFDSGSAVDLVNIELEILSQIKIEPYNGAIKLTGAFGANTSIYGTVTFGMIIDNVMKFVKFLVVNSSNFMLLLGQPSMSALKLKLENNTVYTKEGRVLGSDVSTDYYRFSKTKTKQILHINDNLENNCWLVKTESQLFPVETNVMQIKSTEKPKLITFDEIELNPGFVVIPENHEQKIDIENQINNLFKENKFQIDESVTTLSKDKLKNLMIKYKDIFPGYESDLGLLPEGYEYTQQFTVETPPPVKIYSVDSTKKKIIKEEIDKLLALGVLEESPEDIITSNLLVVPKKDGSRRVVIDLRNINLVTKPSNLQLPNMMDMVHNLMGREFYFSTDICKAFWNSIVPEQQRK